MCVCVCVWLPGVDINIDNIFLCMLAAKEMLFVGMKPPFSVLHQGHVNRGTDARVDIRFRDLEEYVGVREDPISVGKPFVYSNPQWGFAELELPEACFIQDSLQPNPCKHVPT